MASTSECSTDFEASGSVVSGSASAASQEQEYDDDEFDDYSDSFESSEPDAPGAAAVSSSTGHDLLDVGTRVQVFWREENEWFDGVIQSVAEGYEPRYHVHYDDGEQQWEGPASVRPLPSTTGTDQYTQLQQMLPLSAQDARAMIDRRVVVYWPDEGEWYNGIVSAAQASPAAMKIEYDDGDSRWEQEHKFNTILLLSATTEEPLPSTFGPEDVQTAAPSSPEQVLYARPYRQVVSDHFQPVRKARPYRCVVEKHSESVIIPRRPYCERGYLHAVQKSLVCSRHTTPHSFQGEKADRIVQTTLSSWFTEP
ncbi:hypothetical protein PC129_g2541 [Phytophthora cactorum]|uniref:Tudor domain-containing protein n=1 Tax=Phytophthora cactorum TaxID=29920 RepID=A0A329RVJ1_9STRA|nr:hypothetical protein Pcac1_g319 [Phytophthora cactorum]KAG2848823.1 hypothetical protein PC111_g248 [Phytophthora cactorum]KAG2849166.1 hypothetical protein PC112_g398 [Phytophthora cactorum]KAG2869075.1 hypothetical protein PC113_g483 [Phytophthora cactorum]KAG2935055.1 hypothetical protein PC114_g760 [Phytophthora cactorum]